MATHETTEGGASSQVADRASSPTEPAIPIDIFCQQCGYNLRGLTGDRCPECGYSLESVRSEVSGIPWVYRKQMGRFRAFWKTVGFAMFHQRRFCDEMARPVDFADSQRFRWMIVLHAYAPFLLVTFGLYRPKDDHSVLEQHSGCSRGKTAFTGPLRRIPATQRLQHVTQRLPP